MCDFAFQFFSLTEISTFFLLLSLSFCSWLCSQQIIINSMPTSKADFFLNFLSSLFVLNGPCANLFCTVSLHLWCFCSLFDAFFFVFFPADGCVVGWSAKNSQHQLLTTMWFNRYCFTRTDLLFLLLDFLFSFLLSSHFFACHFEYLYYLLILIF